jgi:tetratricopeptide (TPR) repeat protein
VCGLVCGRVPAAAEQQPSEPASPKNEAASPASGDLRLKPLQPGDEELEPLQPRQLPSPDDERRAAARTWFMTGRIHEARGASNPAEFDRALAAYRRTLELDPAAIEVYQSLVPILYTRNSKDESRKYALQAAGHSEAGFQIVRGLAAIMVRGDSLADAAGILKEALKLSSLEPQGITALVLHRDLGIYLHMSEHAADAAESFRLVMEALGPGRQPPLTDEQRTQLLGDDPGPTYDEFGKTFLDAKLPDLAVAAFDEAAKHRQGRPGIHSFNLALVFRETGKPEEALAELDKYFEAQLQSKGRGAYQLLKDLLSDLKRESELVPRLEKLAEQDPRNSALSYFLADAYLGADQVEEADELFRKTMGSSTDPRGLLGMMSVHRRRNEPRELLKVLGQLYPQMPEFETEDDLQKLPEDVRELVERFTAEREALVKDQTAMDALMSAGRELQQGDNPQIETAQAYVLGKLAVQAERTEDAINFYKLTISMVNEPTPNLYRELGEYLIDKKEYKQASEVFREGADHPALQPVRWVFLYFLTYALEFQGETAEALKVIAEARGSQPDNPQLHFQEAWINYHAERWDKAEELFKDVIAAYPEESRLVRNAQFSLSNIYVQQGDKVRGEKILEDVLKEDPEDTQANNDLGYLWADQGKNLEQARTMIEKALKEEPDNAAYLDSMGWVLYRLEQYEEARKYLEQAASKPNGQDATILDHLGDSLDKLGLREEAVKSWQKAVQLEREKPRPDDELVKKIEQKIPADAAKPPDQNAP